MTQSNDTALTPFDAGAERAAVAAALAGSDELEDLTAAIDVGDMTTILAFGADAARDIGLAADAALRAVNRPRQWDSGALTEDLARLMARLRDGGPGERPGLLERLRGNARSRLDREAERYDDMGAEVDRLYVRLRAWEADLNRENAALEALYQANLKGFRELEKYAVAGEQGCRELRDYMARLREGEGGFERQTLEQALSALERRVIDLRTAEAVALQALPMLRAVQGNNARLADVLNAAFIVTLPTFKQALAEAVRAKRESLRDEALSALARRGGKAVRAGARAADVELERARQAVLRGIGEVRALEEDFHSNDIK